MKELVSELISAPSCCKEAKEKANAYLNGIDHANADDLLKDLIEELEDDITPIDELVEFSKSNKAKEIFGEKGSVRFIEYAKKLKEDGAKYCDCPACQIALKIIEQGNK